MREQYLDGLRGWAALIVVAYHITLMIWGELHPPFKLLVLDGPFAVYIFFALSGYVLSVANFRGSSKREVFDMALRRYPRLTIPIFAISALALSMMLLDVFANPAASKVLGTEWWLGIFYTFDPGLFDMLYYSLWVVFFGGNAYWYNSSLWTMPTEMIGSLLIFAFLLIAGRSSLLRLLGHALFIGICWWLKSFMLAMALGVAIAHFVQSGAHQRLKNSTFGFWCSWILLAAGLFGAGQRTDTYASVSSGFSAAAVVYAVMINAPMQRALSLPFSQWLGKLSFSLYLVHILVICSVGSWAAVALAEIGWLTIFGKLFLFAATLVTAVAAAIAFYPVDRFGIEISRRFARAVLGMPRVDQPRQDAVTLL
ncbi:acyltransferase family protein [Variovorax sp. RCC_210]|uniref:acyltransferase family protein n=1 Tax=Variovorax sp. RCC_210 TaxID=3239217 RepID=UPI003523A717